MSDENLLAMPQEAFVALVEEAFQLYAKGSLPSLAKSALAQSSLVADCLLAGERGTAQALTWGMEALLYWGVKQLKPAGPHDFKHRKWRLYNVLYYPYLEDYTFERVAELAVTSNRTIYNAREAAIELVADIFRDELQSGAGRDGRKFEAVELRFKGLPEPMQLVLRRVAIFRQLIPVSLYTQLADVSGVVDSGDSLAYLKKSALLAVIKEEDRLGVQVNEDAGLYLSMQLTETQQHVWHQAAGQYYVENGDYLEASYHFGRANHYEQAARVLIDYYQVIMAKQETEQLLAQLLAIPRDQVKINTWAELKMIAGNVAQMVEDVQTALEQYRLGLQTDDLEIKARIYHRLAKTVEAQNLDDALAKYGAGIALLQENDIYTNSLRARLAALLMDRAYIYIMERPDFEQAKQDLEEAERILRDLDQVVGDDDRVESGHLEQLVDLFANQFSERQLEALCFSLGLAYEDLYGDKHEEQAASLVQYLHQSKRLVELIEVASRLHPDGMWERILIKGEPKQLRDELMKQWVNLHNLWGTIHRRQGNKELEFRHRQQAGRIAYEIGDKNLIIKTIHNLGLSYAYSGRYELGLYYGEEALQIAEEIGDLSNVAKCLKTIGGAYWGLKRLAEAAQRYERAYAIFAEMDNQNWLAHICFDLAEVYGDLEDYAKMGDYFDEAVNLAKSLGEDGLLAELDWLAKQYVGLVPPTVELKGRQLEAFEYVKLQGSIDRQTYIELTGVSKRTAVRDLNDMVEKKVLRREGQARQIQYVMG
ncbi:MAG TPA: tetratricopeptide repeat protein [Anaerolineae bacterium]|nr:tetratricopeptide repeat protein [Anaerolineae bacterium]